MIEKKKTYHTVNWDTQYLCVQLLELSISVAESRDLYRKMDSKKNGEQGSITTTNSANNKLQYEANLWDKQKWSPGGRRRESRISFQYNLTVSPGMKWNAWDGDYYVPKKIAFLLSK